MAEEEETQETELEEAETSATVEKSQETPTSKQPANELKVMINIKDDDILLGVQAPDCDAVFKTLKGTMAVALKQVPVLLKEAKEKWAAAPRYPKADLPEPAPSPTPARTPAASRLATKPAQPKFF